MIKELTPLEKNKLGLLKAIELSNACVKLGLVQVDPQLAHNLSELVRKIMRERVIKLSGLTVSLKEESLTRIIDHGARQFHLGKQDKAIWLQACAASKELCDELRLEINDGLKQLLKLVPGYTSELMQTVTLNFL